MDIIMYGLTAIVGLALGFILGATWLASRYERKQQDDGSCRGLLRAEPAIRKLGV